MFDKEYRFSVIKPVYSLGSRKYFPKEFKLPFLAYCGRKRKNAKSKYLLVVNCIQVLKSLKDSEYEDYLKYLVELLQVYFLQTLLYEKELEIHERKKRVLVGYTSKLRRRSPDIRHRFLFNP